VQPEVVFFPVEGLGVSHRWLVFRRYTTVQRLTVTGIPAGAALVMRCRGGGCPFAARTLTFPTAEARRKLAKRFAGRRLRPGARIDLRITAPGWVGRIVRFTIRDEKAPKVRVRCLPPGATEPTRC
jgi:hypothetical protein